MIKILIAIALVFIVINNIAYLRRHREETAKLKEKIKNRKLLIENES